MNFFKQDDDEDQLNSQPAATGDDADLAMLMCAECEEPEAVDEDATPQTMPLVGADLAMLMCGECEEEDEDESRRAADPDPAPPPSIADLKMAHDAKRLPGNSICFECDAPLSPWRDPWLSLTYGTLLCAACAQQHLALGTTSGAGSLVSSVPRCSS